MVLVGKQTYLSLDEAAERLGVSRQTLWRWIEAEHATVLIGEGDLAAIARTHLERPAPDPAVLAEIARHPMTPERIARQQAAIDAVHAFHEELRATRGPGPFPSNADDVAAMREERSLELEARMAPNRDRGE